ncbi:hypothetical protein Zmor_013821 [Zophobas morio]|uniref:Uncharacterized protein n=1 Tax=Zophobas morio TaxID=2755281 RepID=A0AA38IDN4_9CUCU|nr:hypothetical protein Zmor_013821 [Zophobas morio]
MGHKENERANVLARQDSERGFIDLQVPNSIQMKTLHEIMSSSRIVDLEPAVLRAEGFDEKRSEELLRLCRKHLRIEVPQSNTWAPSAWLLVAHAECA